MIRNLPFRAAALAAASLVLLLAGCDDGPGNTASSDEGPCPIDRPIVFAGLDWDSARFHNAVAARILRGGFGCATDEIPGSSIPLVNGLARGDVDVMMEVWRDNLSNAWTHAARDGKVMDIGPNFPDAAQGWFVPAYLVEGPNAAAPGLKSVADLPRYKDLFRDPEEPSMGRFYNCIAGWVCELINTRKLAAYGLDSDFTNFRPGTGEALAAAVTGAVKREQPILFYYWSPTWLMGMHDFVKLEEPPFDQEVWDVLEDESKKPIGATAFPLSVVAVGVNSEFAAHAPEIVDTLRQYETTAAIVAGALAAMREEELTADEAAGRFLNNERALWRSWLPDDAAARLTASLDAEFGAAN